jgi:PAS domain-containing protein
MSDASANPSPPLDAASEWSEQQVALAQQAWLDAQLDALEGLLRTYSNDSLDVFAQNLIRHLGDLTEAFAGAFYVCDTQNQTSLTFSAGYAAHQSLTEAPALAYQCLEQKERIYLEDLPGEYLSFERPDIQIRTAAIIFYPLLFNEEAFGVLEFSFLRPLERRHRRLLRQINSSIAAILKNKLNTHRMERLLGEMQQQTEQLRAQEEEMRQNMEELQATHEQMEGLLAENQARVLELQTIMQVSELLKETHDITETASQVGSILFQTLAHHRNLYLTIAYGSWTAHFPSEHTPAIPTNSIAKQALQTIDGQSGYIQVYSPSASTQLLAKEQQNLLTVITAMLEGFFNKTLAQDFSQQIRLKEQTLQDKAQELTKAESKLKISEQILAKAQQKTKQRDQEQKAEIAALKAEIATLKAQIAAQ